MKFNSEGRRPLGASHSRPGAVFEQRTNQDEDLILNDLGTYIEAFQDAADRFRMEMTHHSCQKCGEAAKNRVLAERTHLVIPI